MFDCKVCTNNQFCKYASQEEVFKRLVKDFMKDYIAENSAFDIEPTCKHFTNAFLKIPRELVE